MGAALPGLAFKQAGHGMQQEPHECAVGFGQAERALESTSGGTGVAKRFAGERLQQEGLSQPGAPSHPSGV